MVKTNFHRAFAAAALSLTSSLALADASVYGKANVSFQNSDNGTDSVTEVVSNASRVGLKGSEDLDGGLKAIYQFEFEVAVDDGQNSNGETFSQRNIFVGLQGNLGTVKFGHFDTPLKAAQKKVDLFNDLEGDIKNIITVNDNRESNTLSYTSPEAPVVFTIAYLSSEDDAVDNGFSGSLAFSQDNLYLAVAFDQDVEAEGSEAVRGVVQYSIGDWQLGALVEQYDDGAESEDAFFVSAQYKVNDWALKAQFGDSDIAELSGQSVSVGADYRLSKPVKLFGFVTALESDDSDPTDALITPTDETYVGVGIEYKF